MTSWDETDEKMLRRLWPTHSAGDISKLFKGKFGRNAVIGKASRLGLEAKAALAGIDKKIRAQRAQQVSKHVHRLKKRIIADSTKVALVVIYQNNQDDLNIPIAQRKKIIDLTSRICHWPVGDPRDAGFFYCGGDNVPGSPYCASHTRRLHVQPQEGSGPSMNGAAHKPMFMARKAGRR